MIMGPNADMRFLWISEDKPETKSRDLPHQLQKYSLGTSPCSTYFISFRNCLYLEIKLRILHIYFQSKIPKSVLIISRINWSPFIFITQGPKDEELMPYAKMVLGAKMEDSEDGSNSQVEFKTFYMKAGARRTDPPPLPPRDVSLTTNFYCRFSTKYDT